jgi:hypothetical protein
MDFLIAAFWIEIAGEAAFQQIKVEALIGARLRRIANFGIDFHKEILYRQRAGMPQAVALDRLRARQSCRPLTTEFT